MLAKVKQVKDETQSIIDDGFKQKGSLGVLDRLASVFMGDSKQKISRCIWVEGCFIRETQGPGYWVNAGQGPGSTLEPVPKQQESVE